MRSLPQLAAVFCSCALLGSAPQGCGKANSAPATGAGSEAVPAVTSAELPVPDDKGRYEVRPGMLPGQEACRTDADCALTDLEPGNCCELPCDRGPKAGTKAWVKALKALRSSICQPHERRFRCDKGPKCDTKGIPEARCANARCEVSYKSLKR